jgi:tetratricopeptide (TPR) repeat protein
LAGSYGEENDPDKAIAEYKRILQKDDTNVVALNGLAWYLRDAQPAKALEYAQRASELAPESADVLDTLAMVQLSNEQFEIARRTIERALAKAPGNSAMQYHRALIYSAAGKIGAAVQGLKELLGTDADFAERGDAQELLNKLESE